LGQGKGFQGRQEVVGMRMLVARLTWSLRAPSSSPPFASSCLFLFSTAAEAKATEPREGRKAATERVKVHGLGRLAAKLTKPAIDFCKLQATRRNEGSKYDTRRLRKEGLVPAVLMPLRNEEKNGTKLLSLELKEIESLLRQHRSDFAKAQLIKLHVPAEDTSFEGWVDSKDTESNTHVIQALIRQFDFHPVSAKAMALSLQRCPPNESVKVKLPLSIIGEDACPGIKRNGYLYPVRPFVECLCDSNDIPPFIEYNISRMNIGERIRIRDLEFHDSIRKLLGRSNNPNETLYKMIKL